MLRNRARMASASPAVREPSSMRPPRKSFPLRLPPPSGDCGEALAKPQVELAGQLKIADMERAAFECARPGLDEPRAAGFNSCRA